MLASSWLDLVVGVDIHVHLVPTPGGPVPTPIPQPYLGLVGDPVGLIVATIRDTAQSLLTSGHLDLPSGPVLVNGLPATTTDESARNTPLLPHLPMPPGISHVTPPSGQASFPLGAIKVMFGGNNAVRMGELALSCADPVPLPTSHVIAIPKGPPVMVMGAPAFNYQRAAAKWVMGKLIRTAWTGVSRLAKYGAKLSRPRLRNLISKDRCTKAGHPVDVANGRVFTSTIDFALPGPLPLVFERSYFSSWSQRDGVLGPGWSHSLDQAVWQEGDLVVLRNAEGQEIVFDLAGESADLEREFFEPISRNTLVRERSGWRVLTAGGLVHHFARIDGDGAATPTFRLTRSTTRHPDIAITYAYDGAGRLREVADSAGRVVKLEHDRRDRLTRILLPDPRQADVWVVHCEYRYSPEGLLVEVVDALRQTTRYHYDGRLMVEETDRNGVTFCWLYDGRGAGARCLRTWGVDGPNVIYNQKLDYDSKNRTTLVTDSYDHKTLYTMSALGAVVEVLDPLGGKIVREYDDDLQLVSETDPAGNRTRYSYGPRGQLTMTLFPDGAQTVVKYEPRFPELVRLFQNEAGAVWRFQHDAHGQLVEVRGPEADDFHQFEWERGFPKRAMRAGGARTEVLERDRWGHATVLRLPTGGSVRSEYDRRGRPVSLTNPYGARQEQEHDLLDRMVTVREPDGNVRRMVFDPEGNLLEESDALGATRFTYASWNRIASREEGATAASPGATIRFVWGQEGELRELRNERNHDHRFTYDPCLRLEREVAFDLQETRYDRDRAGRVTRVEKPHAQAHTELKLDPCGRVVAVDHADGTWAKYVYRRDGELIEAANESAVVSFKKDALGRVVSETVAGVEVKSFYGGGARTRVESSLGVAFDLLRDPAGNLEGLSIGLPERGWVKTATFNRDEGGLETRRHLPGGVVAGWQHDPSGRPARQTIEAGTPWTRDYRWSYDDRLSGIADSHFGASRFDHDPRGRLVAEHRGADTQHSALDEVGNIYRTPDRSDRRYARGGVVRNDGDTAFVFDALGNLVERDVPGAGTWRYSWNGAGMLTEVARPDGLEVRFSYDALGRRLSKMVGALETRWFWDGDVLLHERTGTTITTWCHEPDSFTPLARVEGSTIHHLVADHLGAPIAAYDETGKLAWQAQLDTFGVIRPGLAAMDTTLVPHRWPGQYEDAEIGLSYNRFRYYDASLGSFVSQDPMGVEAGLNLHSYVPDPLIWTDPLGLTFRGPAATFDWEHILSGHHPDGARYAESIKHGEGKTAFHGLTETQIKRVVRDAWRARKRVGSQPSGGRIKYVGQVQSRLWKGIVEMYYDAAEKSVATAYPRRARGGCQ
jgi:RHS repeat-associated protein